MEKYSSQKTKNQIRILGIYQIAGGLIGLFLTLRFLSNFIESQTEIILLFFIAISLYCYSLLCGIFIFINKDKQLNYSLINQYLQLINFAVLGYSFNYVSGIYLFTGVDFTNEIEFKFTVGISTWHLSFNSSDNLYVINLNLVALFIIIFIDRIKKKLHEIETEVSISKIAK